MRIISMNPLHKLEFKKTEKGIKVNNVYILCGIIKGKFFFGTPNLPEIVNMGEKKDDYFNISISFNNLGLLKILLENVNANKVVQTNNGFYITYKKK